MEMTLLDWTRMGRSYCLAGAINTAGSFAVVRPLLVRARAAPVRNVGWPSYLLDGHARWEVFDLLGPAAAAAEAPHLEDLWVRALQPKRSMASLGQRREILHATRAAPGEPLFGAPLTLTRATAYLPSGTGRRSLATVVVPTTGIHFSALHREGTEDPDVRVTLPVPDLAGRSLPVKDHHLLCRAELASDHLDGRVKALERAVRQMGEQVAVRLGLSRAFDGGGGQGEVACWLMADGFFSLTDPQP